MSPKALIRQHGIFVDENNQPLEGRIKALKKRIMISQANKNIEDIIKAQDELEKLNKKGKWLIDLQGRILLFLEPPHPDVWTIVKPILSHDAWDIEHPYVDADLKTKYIVTRGWPTCIFCSARDESKWDIWPEIQSRFIITSPNMSQEKYLESNMLTFQKSGLPNFVQQKIVVSDFEVDLARKCIEHVKQQIKAACHTNYYATEFRPINPVWIPYQQYLAESLPSNKGPSMRAASYISSLLDIIAVVKSNLYVDFGIEKQIIARLEDLAEVLRITRDMTGSNYTGIPEHKVRFLKEIFFPTYHSKVKPETKNEKTETVIGVTTRELCDFHKERKGRGITTDNLKKQYLNELLSNDIIGEAISEVDKRQHLYYPLVEIDFSETDNDERITKLSNNNQSYKILYDSFIQLPKNCRDISENWLVYEILGIVKYRMDLANLKGSLSDFINKSNNFGLYDKKAIDKKESGRLTIKEFISEYESKMSIRDLLRGNFYKFHSKIFGKMIGICILSEIKPKKLQSDNKFDNLVISNASNCFSDKTISMSNFNSTNQNEEILEQKMAHVATSAEVQQVENSTYKMNQVEEFFSNNPGNKYYPSNMHVLEQSPCYPIIYAESAGGKTWYYCKLHSDIIGPDLSSVELHCMSFRPEQHKSEILKILNGQMKQGQTEKQ